MSHAIRRLLNVRGAAIIAVTAMLFSGCASISPASGTTSVSLGFSAVYGDLDPWGNWVASARYGQVWCPDVDADWSPYSYGDWVWSDQGWLWSSYEPYGWIVYHYGNWYFDDAYGWCWVPGNHWSPANVVWARYGDYVCWAPAPPHGVHWSQPWQASRHPVWNVVASADFTRENVVQFRVRASAPPARDGGHRIAYHAPDVRVVERDHHAPINRIKVIHERRSAGGRQLMNIVLPREEMARVERNQGHGARRHDAHASNAGKRGR